MKEELGKFFIDVAKLILAGVILTSVVQDIHTKWIVYTVGSSAVILFLVMGLLLIKKKEVKNDY